MIKNLSPRVFILLIGAWCIPYSVMAQTISYVIPDIGTSGHNTYVEFIGPNNQNGNFGTDGLYANNPGDAVQVICANPADTAKINFGPVVVSWNGKMVATQVFVLPGINPNSTDWKLLAPAYKIPIQVLLNGTTLTNADTFYIVQSQPAVITAGAVALGSGGTAGIRSRRGAMIFDSLIFNSGAGITIDLTDCDPFTGGNQGFLPATVLSLGRVFIDNGVTVSVNAPGAQNPDAGPGGGGGGTETWTNNTPCNGGSNPNAAGAGFTGGGTEKLCCAEIPGSGTGPGATACLGCGGNSLNGALGGGGGNACVDEDVGAGGTGHPFGTSGINGISPGGYGGGSGWQAFAGGGYGADGIAISAPGSEGKANGNMEMVPFAGGSGGSGGVCGPGSFRGGGGGGGGGLSLHAFFSSELSATGQVQSTGGNGVNGASGYRGGGGGSGGGVMTSGKLSSQGNGTIDVTGGAGGIGPAGAGGSGGAGRVRVDGPFSTWPAISPVAGAGSSTSYNGPSTDTSHYVPRSFNLAGSGNGQPIHIYLKPMSKNWQMVATVSGYTSTWTQNIILPCPDTVFLLTAVQQVASPSLATYTTEPSWIFSQAAANFLVTNSHFVANFNADTACLNSPTNFTDQSSAGASQWNWDFGDGNTSVVQNPAHTYAAAGNYHVTLVSSDVASCSDSVTKTITVYRVPLANFSVDTVCLNTPPTHFTDLSDSAIQWAWDFGDGGNSILQNPAHAYASGGLFNVTLIVSSIHGCKDTSSGTALVNAVPVALFSAGNVCFPTAVAFNNNTSTGAASYAWSFGDGQFSSQQNPSHIYSASGTYQVTLTAISSAACPDTFSKAVTVNPKPQAGFTATQVCAGSVSVFTNTSSVSQGNIATYGWSFGDGTFDTQQNATHTYAGAGTYNTSLAVQTDSGCVDTFSQPVVVAPLPVAAFSTTIVCQNQGSVFSDNSTIASGSITQWTWNFGDGQTSSLQNPAHTYLNAGTYNVTLISTSNNNCSDTLIQTDTVEPLPLANFGAPAVCQGLATTFTDSSSILTGTINSRNWNYGDGQSGNAQNPSHTYQNAGTYRVSQSVTSNSGCTDTITKPVIVYPLPSANFNAPDVCIGKPTVFSDSSSIASGNIAARNWSFGDGNTSHSSSPSNSYAATGVYAVKLLAISDKGCPDSVTKNVQVYSLPSAVYSATPACYAENNGTATIIASGGTAPYSYSWNNGQTSATITHLFSGTYMVTITDANTCSISDSAVVAGPAGPLSVIVTPPSPEIELGKSITINLGNSYNELNVSYSTAPAYALSCGDCPQFDAYPYQTTTYNVSVTDSNGCVGNGAFTIIVNEAVPVFIPNVFTPNGDGRNDTWGIISSSVKFLHLSVFNRIGEKVFDTNNINEQWDGMYKGVGAPEGVYVYTATVVYLNDVTRKLSGSLTLIR